MLMPASGQDLLGLRRVRRAVLGLEGVRLTSVARWHDGVQRVDRAVVGVLRDRVAVDDLRGRLADRQLLADRTGDVPDPVTDLRALARRDGDVGVLLQGGDIGRCEAAPGDVDLAGLRSERERGRVRVVLDEDLGRLALVGTGVVRVEREHGLVGGLVLVQLVGPGADDLVVGQLLVGREDLLVDDRRRAGVGEDVLERRVRVVEVEDHGGGVRRLDRALVQRDRAVLGRVGDAAEQVDRGAVGVLDLDRPLEAVLHVRGGQRVTVGELLARVELARERLGVVVGAGLGGVADDLRRVRRDRHQGLVQVVLERGRAQVVGPGRVERGHGVRRTEDPRVTGPPEVLVPPPLLLLPPQAARATASAPAPAAATSLCRITSHPLVVSQMCAEPH